MPQRRHLPNDARLRAIGMLDAGMRQVEVARFVVVVVLLFYVHGKHLRSCRDGQLT